MSAHGIVLTERMDLLHIGHSAGHVLDVDFRFEWCRYAIVSLHAQCLTPALLRANKACKMLTTV